MIAVHGLTKRYGSTHAVSDLSFRIRRGFTISPRVVEKHVASIFAKLGLPASTNDNRRVLATIRYLES